MPRQEGFLKIRTKKVVIDVEPFVAPFSPTGETTVIKRAVNSINLLNNVSRSGSQGSTPQGLAGPQEYVSILCKFADNVNEPQDYDFFNDMYGNSPGQLGHFWQEVSSNNMNLAGSKAYGGIDGNGGTNADDDWYTLPSNRSAYVNLSNPNGDLDKLFTDCVGVADAHIDFTNVQGINLMFNDTFSFDPSSLGFAWGGSRVALLDGVYKSWPTTWEPTWGWANVAVMAHEMGHSFGLPHSNNSDNDGYPYDSPWSVMSDAWSYGVQDAVYGTRGKHINSYEKDRLNWIGGGEMFTAPDGETHTLNVDSLSDSLAGTGAYRMIKIPFISENKYYTVETRETTGDYEANLAGTAVIIHTVDETRQEPSWVVDADTPADDDGDSEGVMWKVGETFTDAANNIEITVNSATARGFEISVNRNTAILPDQVTLVSPLGTITNSQPTYTWNAAPTVDGKTTWYKLKIISDGNTVFSEWYNSTSANCPIGTGTCSATPSFSISGTNSWSILTWNRNGYGPISDLMNFSDGTPVTPTQVTLVSPLGTITNSQPTYTWNAAPTVDGKPLGISLRLLAMEILYSVNGTILHPQTVLSEQELVLQLPLLVYLVQIAGLS